MQQLFNKLLNMFFPPQCASCATSVSQVYSFCHECWKGITFISKPWCNICGIPFPTRNEGVICMHCEQSRPGYDLARSVVRFDDATAKLIHALKYHDHTELAPAMAKLMYHGHKNMLNDVDVICPIPLHPRRLKKRKYNQSLILARHLARLGKKKLIYDLLLRRKDIPSQSGLNRQERFHNVNGAFEVNHKYLDSLQNSKILLVDDVITTGATLSECALELKKSNITKIYGISFARSY